jgi:hypothetical protein
MTVARLQSEANSRELSEWIAYDRIESSESWVQTGQVCAVIANVMGGGKRKYSAEDFVPVKPIRVADDLKDKLALFAQAFKAPTEAPRNSFGKLHGG